MQIELSPLELSELKKIQRNVVGTSSYVKITCILMLCKGFAPGDVSESLGIDLSSVYRYLTSYKSHGVDSLLENKHKGYWVCLTATN